MRLVQIVELLGLEFFQFLNANLVGEFLDLEKLLLVASLNKLQLLLISIQNPSEARRLGFICGKAFHTAHGNALIEPLIHQVVEIVKRLLTSFFASQNPVKHDRVAVSV